MNKLLADLNITTTAAGAFGRSAYEDSSAPTFKKFSPIDCAELGIIHTASKRTYDQVIADAETAFARWRSHPAPKRGELVRDIGCAIREKKKLLGELVSIETGKIRTEGEGEIQEIIDIADFAVGLSRQLYGNQMHSERPSHQMFEQWQPLGVVGVITAFNFPAAVWGWNAMLAAICGDATVWKPSEHAPFIALALHKIASEIAERHGFPGLFGLVLGTGAEFGMTLAADRRIALLSATGSVRMGKAVAETVAKRLGKSILELAGNNAVTILADADLSLAVRSTVFGAVGTAGQRCTTTRRLFVERPIFETVTHHLVAAYKHVRIGDPLHPRTLMGPLIHQGAVNNFLNAVTTALDQGGTLLHGGKLMPHMMSDLYVMPTLIATEKPLPIMQEETFGPLLYVTPVDSLAQAIDYNNNVPQGLSSAIFTQNLQKAQEFIAATGSDCGIANVNLGTSGAEIGGAFGGEKDTGGGRESGSDAWKQYMRRQTTTINYSGELRLAQAITFS